MTDPSASQTVAALAQSKGETVVAMTVLRRYWKPVAATAGAILGLGTIIQQGRDARDELVKIEAAQTAQAVQNAAVNDRLTHLEAEWGALFGAAHITVTPNQPVPPTKNPRKGTTR